MPSFLPVKEFKKAVFTSVKKSVVFLKHYFYIRIVTNMLHLSSIMFMVALYKVQFLARYQHFLSFSNDIDPSSRVTK